MSDTKAIIATVENYCATFGSERSDWLANFAADAWIEDPVGSPRRNGVDDIGDFWDETHAMSDSTTLQPLTINAVGGEAAFSMQARVVIGGETFGMKIIDVMTFDGDAKITTMRAFWDMSTMAPLVD